jgi:uncharacterized protein (DUF1499 family)
MTRNVEYRTMKRPMKNEPIKDARSTAVRLAIGFAVCSASACVASSPLSHDVFDDGLEACPASPNCVNSRAEDERHRIEPISLTFDGSQAWQAVVARVRDDSKATVVVQSDYYLLAEYRSTVFAFIDDLQLLLRDDRTTVDVRSASRFGYWDWGVNRSRVEELRDSLRKDGIAQ